MENNATIKMTLKALLNILDARAYVTIFTSETEKVSKDSVNVFELLADKDFINTYGKYNVAGLISFAIDTNILITKERI